VSKRLDTARKAAKSGVNKADAKLAAVLEKIETCLNANQPVASLDLDEEEQALIKDLRLLTQKPMLFVVNVSEETLTAPAQPPAWLPAGSPMIRLCAKIEAELADLEPPDTKAMLKDLGLKDSGLDQLIKAGYSLLDLQTYFTCGPKETRAWTIRRGTKAPQAAGVIHTDFEKGFIRAEVIDWQDFVELKGESGARDAGKLRTEGKEYIMRDGDVCHFLFNK
jgi:GTP-binding protein YchF